MNSKYPFYFNATPQSGNNARRLRKKLTPAEDYFWQMVRGRRLFNLKIRRQHPVGPFIVDFYCHELRLVIEIDGEIHDLEDVKLKDIRREDFLRELDLQIIRFTNDDVFRNSHVIGERISALLK
jgi:very-short-patch-repair endonuclease